MCPGVLLQKSVDGLKNALLFAVDSIIIKYAGHPLDLQHLGVSD